MRSIHKTAAANLCKMVSWCFQATPTTGREYDDAMYLTREQQANRPKLPWFLGGEKDNDGEPAATAAGSAIGDMFSSDRTAIEPPNQQPRRWIKDDAIDNCMDCDTSFDLFTRKHHCRGCGLVFCQACTAGSEPVVKFGFLDPVRLCSRCVVQARSENVFYEQHLPLLECGDIFIKHGLLIKRMTELKFVRAKLLFQYQTIDTNTRKALGDFKAFTLDSITDVKPVPRANQGNGMFGLLITAGNEEHRLDTDTMEQRDQWLAALQSVRSLRKMLVDKERMRRAKQVEAEHQEMLKRTASMNQMEERKASFRQDRLRRRAEQRESLRAKYNIAAPVAS
ncbi:hypothetical protein Poli38472_010043 [Pythium oligandrum]|uniref:FYVE-type domain-containing protein n=1 Tax=Pythium oligandrum TaxID=41045 RepID=A0A8K1FEZ9_PYTOL|nr:hypothetical protein Poli38472_010043 [Pythium oligandrum]|eukprot:TMW58484.1 hypothetical protein Poli38472_010043 [Pythium oligandrum]